MKFLAVIFVMLTSLAAAPATDEAVRFATVDIRIDPSKALAAFQVEFIADSSHVKLVGVEGGDQPGFTNPPYYDPAALSRNRVIVAAFSAGKNLPTSPFRAARLHVQITGSDKPNWEAKLQVAADADGKTVPATVTLVEGAGR